MKKLTGKIILVDDKKYEKQFLELALLDKGWEVKLEYFMSAVDALDYLKKTQDEIFLIISDMNMPEMNGLDFKKAIDKDLEAKQKSIPFIFSSTDEGKGIIKEAFLYRVQGYFNKTSTPDEQAELLDIIIRYWIICSHPNDEFNKDNIKLI